MEEVRRLAELFTDRQNANRSVRVSTQASSSALRRLDRETLVAFSVRGQSLVEMSDAFDAPVGTIKRRLHVVVRLVL